MNAIKRAVQAALGPYQYDEVEVARRVLRGRRGLMVDVGAHRGFAHTPFADREWQVLALEPDPANRVFLEEAAHPNVTIDPRAITDTDGQQLTLYTSEVSSGISTLAPFHESHHPGVEVETVRLDTVLADWSHVDFLKVDTEGFDLPVLRTFDWSDRPDVVVCEFEDRKTVPLGYTYRDLGDFLLGQGYAVFMSEWHPIVEYGRAHDWRRVVRYPEALLDANGWGNFIAVRPEMAGVTARVARRAGRRLAVRRAYDRMRGR
jgi:FkbM family methyltransferase